MGAWNVTTIAQESNSTQVANHKFRSRLFKKQMIGNVRDDPKNCPGELIHLDDNATFIILINSSSCAAYATG